MSDNKPPPADNPAPARAARMSRPDRRRWLRSVLLAGGVFGAALSGYLPLAYGQRKRLRPPGALDEKDLLGSCIKCGQCVQVCPVQAIKLADLVDGFGVGVPYIDPRQQACDFSCDAVQCILACPTGALAYHKPDFLPPRAGAVLAAKPILKAKEKDAEPTLNLKERMGVARLVRPESCLAIQGKGFKGQARGASFKGRMRYMTVDRWKPIAIADHPYEVSLCNLCVTECPVQGAISMETFVGSDGMRHSQPVVHEPCVGCGVCEMVCPTEQPCIVIEAQEEWKV